MSNEIPGLESYVQVGPDSTGKKVRNLIVTVPAADGSATTAYMQVVGLADADGFPIPETSSVLTEILGVLHEIRDGIDILKESLA